MSDKELDQLFQSRFDSFEAKPSASLWSSIESQLENKPQKRPSMPVFWMAAASVVVLLGAGLWLFQPEQKIYLEGDTPLAKVDPVPHDSPVASEMAPVEEIRAAAVVKVATVKAKKVRSAGAGSELEIKEAEPQGSQEAVVMMARVEPEVMESRISEPAVAAASQEVQPHSRRGEVHQTVLAMLPPEEAPTEDQPLQQRRKIRSVGDIVNFVVAKVDQREDKLIEISEDDEGTKISGINLGLFKIKSKKR